MTNSFAFEDFTEIKFSDFFGEVGLTQPNHYS